MGVNNRQRRAEKQRKAERERRRRQQARGDREQPQEDFAAAYEMVDRQVRWTLRVLSTPKQSEKQLLAQAGMLMRAVSRQPGALLDMVLADRLTHVVDHVRSHGWDADDLEQLVARNAGRQHLGVLRAALTGELPIRLESARQLASALAVALQLGRAPLLSGSLGASRPAHRTDDHPKLAQVRALLAKAESTEFEAEAEALTAKAQELVARYSLDRLLAQGSGPTTSGDDLAVRRIWIDPPYVGAKLTLVHQVSLANRCRAAAAASLGYSVVVGAPTDLAAVEMLVTSLLVQADVAMLHQGSRVGRAGRSRTRAFRQSFLTAFAVRIGERLEQVAKEAVAAEDTGGLLPVLRDHESRVGDAFDAVIPHTTGRSTSVTDGEGWAAGHAAADLAQLDVNDKLQSPL